MSSLNTLLGLVAVCLLINLAIGNEAEDGPVGRGIFPTRTTCDYSTQPGLSCLSCNEVLRCNRNNVGYITTCGFLLSYCNNGFCSLFPGPECEPTTTETPTSVE